MSWGFITTLRNARMDAITTAVGASGRLRLYDGTQPATGGAATNAALSGTCTWCRVTTSQVV